MSWWVTDYIAVSEDETQQLCNIQADAFSDLPAQDQTATAGFIFVRGSKAEVLETSGKYIMNSSGQWILQKSGQEIEISADDIVYDNTSSGMTATNVQDAIDELHDTDETQDNALTELYGENANQQLEIDYAINTGAKNMLYISNAPGYTATSHGRTFTVLSDGGIKITGASSDSSNADFYIIGSWSNRSILINEDQDSCLMRMSCDTDYGYNQIRLRAMNRSTGSTVNETGVETNKDVRLSHIITTVFISVWPSVTLPEDGVVVYPMIRRAEITDSTYVPYAPTNRELYETKADKGSFNLTIAGSPLVTSEYSYSCIVTGDIATVCIRLILADVLDVNTSRNLFKIPVGYRPPQAVAGTGYADGKVRVFWINTSGDVKIRIDEAIPSGATINVNFCYSYNPTNWTTVTANQLQSLNSPLTLNLDRNDLNESLDTNFDLIDSIPEEEEGEEDDI